MSDLNPRIYVACLASYNAGHLYGKWIDATQNVDVIKSDIQSMLEYSKVYGAEEWAIHDYDDFYEAGSYLGEYPDLEDIVTIAELLKEHGKIVAKLVEHFSGDVEDVKRSLEENYAGCYESLADYAEEFCQSCYEIPKWCQYYINWKSMAEDWEMNGDIFSLETSFEEVHVFYNS